MQHLTIHCSTGMVWTAALRQTAVGGRAFRSPSGREVAFTNHVLPRVLFRRGSVKISFRVSPVSPGDVLGSHARVGHSEGAVPETWVQSVAASYANRGDSTSWRDPRRIPPERCASCRATRPSSGLIWPTISLLARLACSLSWAKVARLEQAGTPKCAGLGARSAGTICSVLYDRLRGILPRARCGRPVGRRACRRR